MASNGIHYGLFLALALMTIHEAMAQSSCSTALIGLTPCLGYVSGNSSAPSSSCCSQLASVVQSQPRCLCILVNGGGSSLGVNINQTLALSLPKACNVQTPPVSRCNAANAPATSPASSPVSAPADSSNGKPDDTPSETPVDRPAASGSKAVPTGTGTSDASASRMQLYLTVFLVSVASVASGVIRF
uniref:Non-specific lipid-transfer protein-like protein At2g13820 isoform X2 n=1 Tax=Rhizophora mucronata TaxID=61149 RepID=A0A2P2P8V3_RHIMU